MNQQRWATVAGVCALFVLASCGGGSGGSSTTTHVVGTIAGFGSVIVNGVEFDDPDASVTVDDVAVSRTQLREGMVVQVRGHLRNHASGVADAIRYSACVRGPVTAVNAAQNTLSVLAQTVHIDDDSVLDGVALPDINSFAVGDAVEVSCLRDRARSRLSATRIERLGVFQNGSTAVNITGRVDNLDQVNRTCTVGGQPVLFGGIASGELPSGLTNGMTVQAAGLNVNGGLLTATRLVERAPLALPNGRALEVEGHVADFVSSADFMVGDQPVSAASADFVNGSAADLANGVRVEAEGTMSNGLLKARLLYFRQSGSVRVEARLQSSDPTARTLTVLGRTISLTDDTLLIDRRGTPTQPRRIAPSVLAAGDRLEISASPDGGGRLVALGVRRTAADTRVSLKGPLDSKTPTTRLVLGGIGVATGANTSYLDSSGAALSAVAFYASVAVPPATPSVVRARGVVADLSATELDATASGGAMGELRRGD